MKTKFKLYWVGEGEGEEAPADPPVEETSALGGDEPPADPPADDPSDWRSSLSEDVRGNELVKDSESLEDFVAKAIKSPDPIDPQSYQLPKSLDSESVRTALSNAGISAEGFGTAYAVVQKHQQEVNKAVNTQRLEARQALYDQWGDNKAGNLNVANSFLEKFDTDGNLAKMLKDTQAGNDPVILDFFYRVGSALREDGFLKVKETGPAPKKSAANTLYPNQGK